MSTLSTYRKMFYMKQLFFLTILFLTIISKIPATERLDFTKIHSEHKVQLIEFIQNFPSQEYQLFTIKEFGSFYIDYRHDWIKSHIVRGEMWEPKIAELIRTHVKPGSTVLDLGAHIGTHTLTMAKATGSKGRVIAFEPQPKIFRELFINMAVNQINNTDFYNMALGSLKGQLELHRISSGNEGATSFLQGSGTGQFVEMTDLDSLHLTDVSFIKIDVEYMESDVIEGARVTILKNRPIMIIEIQGSRSQLTKDLLQELGYNLSHLHGVDYLAVPQ